MPKKKAAKSHKADGTPKKRWSSTERAARGHGPRTRGGQNSRDGETRGFNRDGDKRTFARDDRGERSFTRDDRGERSFNPERRSTFRDDRGPKRDERRPWSRDDRGERGFNRDDRRPTGRDDRAERGPGRDDRRPFNRDDRGFNRDERGDRGFNRDDRRPFNRDDRRPFNRDERPRNKWSDDRAERGPARDDRRPFNRDDRGGRDERRPWNRDDRGPSNNRDERPRNKWNDDRSDRPNKRHFADSGEGRDRRGPARDFHDHAPRKHHREHNNSWRDSGPRDFDGGAPEADQMSWQAAEAQDLQVSEADEKSGFAELGVALPIVATLASKGIVEPFPIQSATIADAIAGRDVLGRGRTGSGKTLAFGLPTLTRLSQGEAVGSPRALILTPTRELALQIADNLSPLAASVGLDLTLIAGGMSYGPQIRAFERGVDIVVATPGRLIDLLEQGAADLSQVQVTILDEADHMSDLGFLPDVSTLLDATPAGSQRLLFSATLDRAVDRLVRQYLSDPVTHEVDSGQASVTTMTHHFLELAPHHKNLVTAEIANREAKTLIFARTQMGADRIAGQLREAGVLAGALHGGLTQGARARVLEAYKEDKLKVLVATDVAARGIHVDDITLVLQVDPPMGPKDYLHRAGRTARAGESGAVVSVVLPHQRKQVRRIADQAGVRATPIQVQPGSVELREATGARTVSETPIAEDDFQRIIAPKQQQRRGPKRGGFGGSRGGRSGGYRGQGRRRDNW
ncbi:DEAD/DEAH box helicase [Tessaracoccus rhinocerotis]|nr:DEAD/DEAH box helicase [Tessaracoccus rhinocerotis]